MQRIRHGHQGPHHPSHLRVPIPVRPAPALYLRIRRDAPPRLHVNIFDTAQNQFTVPTSIINPPAPPTEGFKSTSDLEFSYESSPFAFWITRRSDPGAAPLFDTRLASLPATPTAPVIQGDASTALDGFPLVFKDQYLQVRSFASSPSTRDRV